jgi:hypothetical protein
MALVRRHQCIKKISMLEKGFHAKVPSLIIHRSGEYFKNMDNA